MTIGAVYASDLSRVRVSCSAAPAAADYVMIERSTDQITWATVRGGGQVLLSAGACQLDDYEFSPGVVNYYRARYVDVVDPNVVAAGAVGVGNNTSVTPGLPAGVVDGDILLMKAAIRTTAGTVVQPAGWTTLVNGGHFKIFTRTYAAGVTAPTVTFTGGAAGDDTLARMVNIRNADYTVSATAVQSNAAAQDIAFSAMAAADLKPNLFVVAAWKQSTATGASVSGWFLMSNDAATAGNDEFMAFFGKNSSADQAAGSMVMSGGSSAISKSTVMRFTRRAYVLQETASLTPTITNVWLKNIQRTFLNRKLTVTGFSEVVQPSRSAAFPIVARSLPVAVTELRGGENFTLTVRTSTSAEARDLKTTLKHGGVVFLQLPLNEARFPSGYFMVGTVTTRRAQKAQGEQRYHDLELEEVAAPSPVVVGTTITYQGIINAFATYSAVIAANATYGDVMNRIGTPVDVVVP